MVIFENYKLFFKYYLELKSFCFFVFVIFLVKKYILTNFVKNKYFYIDKMIQFDPNESLLLEKFTIQSYQRNNLNEYKNNSRFLGFNNIRNKNGLLYYDKLDNLMPLRNASSKSYSGHSIGSSISMDVEEPRVNAKHHV